MKSDLHPTYHTHATVTCACGNTFETGSTHETIQTELCNLCHPFFTGTQKIIDTAHRVERFETLKGKKAATVRSKTVKKTARRTRRAQEKREEAEKLAVE